MQSIEITKTVYKKIIESEIRLGNYISPANTLHHKFYNEYMKELDLPRSAYATDLFIKYCCNNHIYVKNDPDDYNLYTDNKYVQRLCTTYIHYLKYIDPNEYRKVIAKDFNGRRLHGERYFDYMEEEDIRWFIEEGFIKLNEHYKFVLNKEPNDFTKRFPTLNFPAVEDSDYDKHIDKRIKKVIKESVEQRHNYIFIVEEDSILKIFKYNQRPGLLKRIFRIAEENTIYMTTDEDYDELITDLVSLCCEQVPY